MPTLVIHGLSPELAVHREINNLKKFLFVDIPKVVARVDALRVSPDQVTVFAPTELVAPSRQEVVVFIEGLWQREERTPEVFNELAERVAECVVAFLLDENRMPKLQLVEVIPRSQRENDGFAAWERPVPIEDSAVIIDDATVS